ncbi:MAG: tetratricopeptide repeat protein [Desulfuromonas sp.]|nr:tetratricopeptide repeat protein [Desulfuromonas sp.]
MAKSALATLALILTLTMLNPATLCAETKIFEHQVDQPFSGSQSPQDAYIAAVARAKSEVLDMAGTYIESLSIVENSVLTSDEATALAAGILKTEIVGRENYATPKTFGLILHTKIEVDSSVLDQRVEKLLNDRSLLRKYSEMQQREQELLARIHQLEQQSQQNNQVEGMPEHIGPQFDQLSAALSASQWQQKALELWSNGRYTDAQQAIDFLDQAVALDPDNEHLYNSRAVAKLSLQQYAAAANDLAKALSLQPDYADAHNNLASLYFQQQQYSQAVTEYSRAIELNPNFAEAFMNRGMAERKLLHYENAFKDFHRAVDLAPQKDKATQEGALLRLDDVDQLCIKAQTACDMGLCRALNFLTQHGFCKIEK